MSNTLRTTLIVLVTVIAAAALLLVGMYFGRAWLSPVGFASSGMMGNFGGSWERGAYGMGSGMMGSFGQDSSFGYGNTGMMGSGMMGYGMMGSGVGGALIGVEPLTIAEAETALEDYLSGLGNDDLEIGEIMIFDNHAYAELIETSTGIGAMEVLVDPVTKAVYPEYGPNMMWNLKYSPMAGSGMMGMMSGFGASFQAGGMMGGQATVDLPAELPVSADEAVQIAQRYLDTYLAGAQADEEADPFYGYYTLHILRDGSTIGMLSVNGYTREVFPHTWHGNLVEMSEIH
jgi:hypothetical protein